MVIEEDVLVAAYDDAAGVTAEFNRNVLHVLNRELGADFDVAAFEHVALWDRQEEWIEMRLRARHDMTVHVAGLGLEVAFAAGEEMVTEISAKFRPSGVCQMLERAGFTVTRSWTDPLERFALTLATAV
jgi:L-histidine N-alpha-methyltransferase